jgi:hypothetical protein
MGVRDRSAKVFDYPLGAIGSASSGSWVKFAWSGALAYPAVVRQILLSGVATHYHIGDLAPERLDEIHAELSRHGLAPDRFQCTGRVPSVWEALVRLPVHVFVGSAPLHGLRTAMEVQGAGIPICPFRQPAGSLMHDEGSFPAEAETWGTLAELADCLQRTLDNHATAALQARAHYERHCTLEGMKAAIEQSHARRP